MEQMVLRRSLHAACRLAIGIDAVAAGIGRLLPGEAQAPLRFLLKGGVKCLAAQAEGVVFFYGEDAREAESCDEQ